MPISPSYLDLLSGTLAQLREIERDYSPAALSNGFGPESMILTDLIARHRLDIDIFSLDTGRLPRETYDLAQATGKRYGLKIHLFTPDPKELEPWQAENGPNAFYESVALRHACCAIRKVSPLRRALAGKAAWLTGLRHQQSVHRTQLAAREWDAENKLHKFNPMVDWTHRQVWDYIRDFNVPYNALHDRGYASIGCAPCTRAISKGEDIRAGRWWWEQGEIKECGLHLQPPAPLHQEPPAPSAGPLSTDPTVNPHQTLPPT